MQTALKGLLHFQMPTSNSSFNGYEKIKVMLSDESWEVREYALELLWYVSIFCFEFKYFFIRNL